METFKCRNSECSKEFVNSSNRSKHEKKTGHYVPGPRRQSRWEPPWGEENDVFMCPKPYCKISMSKKSNMIRHIKTCNLIADRKRKRENDKACPFCDKLFEKKFNRDRHIKAAHSTGDAHVPLSFVFSDDGVFNDNDELPDEPTRIDDGPSNVAVAGPSTINRDDYNIHFVNNNDHQSHTTFALAADNAEKFDGIQTEEEHSSSLMDSGGTNDAVYYCEENVDSLSVKNDIIDEVREAYYEECFRSRIVQMIENRRNVT